MVLDGDVRQPGEGRPLPEPPGYGLNGFSLLAVDSRRDPFCGEQERQPAAATDDPDPGRAGHAADMTVPMWRMYGRLVQRNDIRPVGHRMTLRDERELRRRDEWTDCLRR